MKIVSKQPRLAPLTVAGIMSGTSADGIDVAIVRINPRKSRSEPQSFEINIKLELLHHSAYPFSRSLRQAVLAAMTADQTTTPNLARLHWRLGLAYAEAASAALTQCDAKVDLVGCHGQTIYHQGRAARWLDRNFACTWQIGEQAVLARALGLPVVANFRPADMTLGGQGAPLVPLLDFALYRHSHRTRILQNIGGIGNLTYIPAGAKLTEISAFDTGPGNMILDALMQQLFGRAYDRSGKVARSGKVLKPVVDAALREPFFRKPTPKSAGREQFGVEYSARFLKQCERLSRNPADAIATAAALTSGSIALACEKLIRKQAHDLPVDFFVSGGGAKNQTLMEMLGEHLEPMGCTVVTLASTGLPVEAKEAAAFALLAYQTWHHRSGNIPSATGAGGPAILGQISYA